MLKKSKKLSYEIPAISAFNLSKIREPLCSSPIKNASNENLGELGDGDDIW